MPVFMTSDLKNRTGEILDAARNEPQFIFRDGQLFMLCPAEPGPGVRQFPEGYFADAYPQPTERRATETQASHTPQTPQR